MIHVNISSFQELDHALLRDQERLAGHIRFQEEAKKVEATRKKAEELKKIDLELKRKEEERKQALEVAREQKEQTERQREIEK